MICKLEQQVEDLIQDQLPTRAVDGGYQANTQAQNRGICNPTPRHERAKVNHTRLSSDLSSYTLTRMPSFMSDQNEETEALRSVYQRNHAHNFSLESLPKLIEEADDGINSPRLSLLSESSFLSVYGPESPILDTTKSAVRTTHVDRSQSETPQPRQLRSSASVERWIEGSGEAASPNTKAQLHHVPVPKLATERQGQFMSINNVLESPLQKLEKFERSFSKSHSKYGELGTGLKSVPKKRLPTGTDRKTIRLQPMQRHFTDNCIHEKNRLPPTPDTISTSTLLRFPDSYDNCDSQPNGTERLTPENRTQDLGTGRRDKSLVFHRPSDAETITSRREGHGWDTETQRSQDDFISRTETESTVTDPWFTIGNSPIDSPSSRPNRIIIRDPDLLNFGSVNSPYNGGGEFESYVTGTNSRAQRTKWNRTTSNQDISPSLPPKAYRENLRPRTSGSSTPQSQQLRRPSDSTSHLPTRRPSTAISQSHPDFNTYTTNSSPVQLASRLQTSSDTPPSISQALRSNPYTTTQSGDQTPTTTSSSNPPTARSRRSSMNAHIRFSKPNVSRVDDAFPTVSSPVPSKSMPASAPNSSSKLPVRRTKGGFGVDGADEGGDDEVWKESERAKDVAAVDEKDEERGRSVRSWLGLGVRRTSMSIGLSR
jgi:hypothetical protein